MKKFLLTCLLVGITTVLVQGNNGKTIGWVYVNDQAWDATLIMNEANGTAILYRSDGTTLRMSTAQALKGQEAVFKDMAENKKYAAIIGWIIDRDSALKLPYNPFSK